jgi:hypothetical protein
MGLSLHAKMNPVSSPLKEWLRLIPGISFLVERGEILIENK